MGHLGCPRCAKTMKDDGSPCPACGFEMPLTPGASLHDRVAHAVSVGFAPRWICTACGTPGNPVTQTKGSFLVEIILWLMMILPGVIYSIWRLTSRAKVCPACRQPSMIPIDSPVAKAMQKVTP